MSWVVEIHHGYVRFSFRDGKTYHARIFHQRDCRSRWSRRDFKTATQAINYAHRWAERLNRLAVP